MDSDKRPRHRPVDLNKRESILDAACEEFFAHGFAAASIESMAGRALVSKVTIYNHFQNKERLFSAVVERECQSMSDVLSQTLEAKEDLRENLIALAQAKMTFLQQPHIIRFENMIAREAENHPHIGMLFLQAGPLLMRNELAQLFEHAIAKGAMKPCDTKQAAGHFYGLIRGFDIIVARFSMAQASPTVDQKQITKTVDLFLQLYAA